MLTGRNADCISGWHVGDCTGLISLWMCRPVIWYVDVNVSEKCASSVFTIGLMCIKGFPESVQPFWISREPVAWPWCNLAASQRRPYCASVNSYSPVGLVIRQWDAVDEACVLCDRRIHNDRTSRSLVITMHMPILQLSRRVFFFFLAKHPNHRWKVGDLWMPTGSYCRLTRPTGEWVFTNEL